MDPAAIAAILAAAGGVIAALTQLIKIMRQYPSRGNSLVSVTSDVVEMYREALADVREQQVRLEASQDATDDLVIALRAELGDGESRISTLESQLRQVKFSLRHYRHGVEILIKQLRRLGHIPEWEPTIDPLDGFED